MRIAVDFDKSPQTGRRFAEWKCRTGKSCVLLVTFRLKSSGAARHPNIHAHIAIRNRFTVRTKHRAGNADFDSSRWCREIYWSGVNIPIGGEYDECCRGTYQQYYSYTSYHYPA